MASWLEHPDISAAAALLAPASPADGADHDDGGDDDDELARLRAAVAVVRQHRGEAARRRAAARDVRERWATALNALEFDAAAALETTRGLETLHARAAARSVRMAQMNAVNDCFYIWHSGAFATINGFRLGRLPSEAVSWDEVNAGLGQVALLLETVARHTGLELDAQRIVPMGSYSRVTVRKAGAGAASNGGGNGSGSGNGAALPAGAAASPSTSGKAQTYNLYTDDSFSLLLARRSFNNALGVLLSISAQAARHVRATDPSLHLPYAVSGDRIDDVPIALGASDQQWTHALKCLLTNLKWLVASVAKSGGAA